MTKKMLIAKGGLVMHPVRSEARQRGSEVSNSGEDRRLIGVVSRLVVCRVQQSEPASFSVMRCGVSSPMCGTDRRLAVIAELAYPRAQGGIMNSAFFCCFLLAGGYGVRLRLK